MKLDKASLARAAILATMTFAMALGAAWTLGLV